VTSNDDLVRIVTGIRPGSTVPVVVVRSKQERTLSVTIEELDLDAETGRARSREGMAPETEDTGFGLTIENLTPALARQLRVPSGTTGAVVTDVDPGNTAIQGVLFVGDVILEINRETVETAADARRMLRAVPAGRRAMILVLRRGQETFVTVRKE
jgi:S1-C subfamily serine protease